MADEGPPRKVARTDGALGGHSLAHVQSLLGEGIDLEVRSCLPPRLVLDSLAHPISSSHHPQDVRFRPVGGGKNAAYVPAEAAVCVVGCACRGEWSQGTAGMRYPRVAPLRRAPRLTRAPAPFSCRAVANEVFGKFLL
jgi:hypothetical protein